MKYVLVADVRFPINQKMNPKQDYFINIFNQKVKNISQRLLKSHFNIFACIL